MIFVGDITSPSEAHSKDLAKVFQSHKSIFEKKTLICNLEGLIAENINLKTKIPVLFNHPSVLRVLKQANVKCVGLANNHTLDLPEFFNLTTRFLKNTSIAYCGAGYNTNEADNPAVFLVEGTEVVLFNACWDFLLYNHKNPRKRLYVSEINEKKLIKSVRESRYNKPDAAIAVFLHWNFDLEKLPFPMHRQFARDLIDNGANLVIGSHSHCVQGGEHYKNGYIIYGLGNFFLPSNTFVNSELNFPDFASLQLAFEWNFTDNTAQCHWFEYSYDQHHHYLKHIASEGFSNSEILSKNSPFVGLSEKSYIRFYRKNRRKHLLIPVYKDYNEVAINRLYTFIIKKKAMIARLMASLKMRAWQN